MERKVFHNTLYVRILSGLAVSAFVEKKAFRENFWMNIVKNVEVPHFIVEREHSRYCVCRDDCRVQKT